MSYFEGSDERVRDVGGAITPEGKAVRQGLLYRGSEMNSHLTITEEGLNNMREVLKINTQLDIRYPKNENVITETT